MPRAQLKTVKATSAGDRRTPSGNPQRPQRQPRPHGAVVTYSPGATDKAVGHQASTRKEIARRLAALMGIAWEGEYDPLRRYAVPPYFVPSITLTSETAARVGVRGECDLFGGVVPYPFVATKTITHPLVGAGSRAPPGWSVEFPRRVADVALDGFSAFAKEDALVAGRRLLERGPVRVKPATGIAGLGQSVVDDAAALAHALDAIDAEEMARSGVVVEQNLVQVNTFSVGRVCVADVVTTYVGTQCLTTNNRGLPIYGGSDITVVRGGFDALLALKLSEDVRLAIAQARAYDDAAMQCFDGFFASRRNYDVAQGPDAAGRRRSGVLEQSWRLGGASGAEIGALEAFSADPSLRTVRAISREIYGEAPALPADAAVYFSGTDAHTGPLTKYAWTEPYADPR
jgi:hypothetical protein